VRCNVFGRAEKTNQSSGGIAGFPSSFALKHLCSKCDQNGRTRLLSVVIVSWIARGSEKLGLEFQAKASALFQASRRSIFTCIRIGQGTGNRDQNKYSLNGGVCAPRE
jgi:hypothetical protein